MMGIDRKYGGPDEISGKYALLFWGKIDSMKSTLQLTTNTKYNEWMPGEPTRSELTVLVSKMEEPKFYRYLKQYIKSEDLKNIILNNELLLWNFTYAVWNGPGWFKSWSKIIEKQYNSGVKDGTQLGKIFLKYRLVNTGVVGNKSNLLPIIQGGKHICSRFGIKPSSLV
jgi:hypothetical protein